MRRLLAALLLALLAPAALAATVYEDAFEATIPCAVTVDFPSGSLTNCSYTRRYATHGGRTVTVTIDRVAGQTGPEDMAVRMDSLHCEGGDLKRCAPLAVESSGPYRSAGRVEGPLPLSFTIVLPTGRLPANGVDLTVYTGCRGLCAAVGAQRFHAVYVESDEGPW